MKTTVDIADQLFERAKQETERTGVTLRELIESGLRYLLEERERGREKPFVLRDASVKGVANPAMRWDERSQHAYLRLMGSPGYPDTIEGINKMLDDDDDEGER